MMPEMTDTELNTLLKRSLDKARENPRMTKIEHQIKALEEAICPRVAARLQSLENARASQQDLNGIQERINQTVYERLNVLDGADKKEPAKPASPAWAQCMGVTYTKIEVDVAKNICRWMCTNTWTFYLPLARELVELIAGV